MISDDGIAWGKEAGLKLEDAKTLLRHEDIATTSNVYGDLGGSLAKNIGHNSANYYELRLVAIFVDN